ncbi:MAG: thioredoxin family protein [Candidatus Altiarchaeota archaeon]|nr:thioredoxin family protein [Candidatus Altiarchaeota archaeon]
MVNKTSLIFGSLVVGLLAYLLFFNSPTTHIIKFSDQNPQQSSGLVKLAGDKSPYYTFNNTEYQKAISENKVILLHFYANWCGICRAEQTSALRAFNALNVEGMVGFRVNFGDSETDSFEEALAREFNVPYQHTKVIVKNGEVLLKDLNAWNEIVFTQKINEVLS